ncbi:conserved hypothetical protein [Listeria monocytogenes str. 1/2a F6854]|nr:conserved hypothetical protein [Listeria monocytogenes str. 1/2a F6854] [Listeria monocytogenes serotype 1/2a str. F6854]
MKKIFAPSLANLMAMSRPIPRDPPVTTATLPCKVINYSPFNVAATLFTDSASPADSTVTSRLIFLIKPAKTFPEPISTNVSTPFLINSSTISSHNTGE